MNFNNSIEEFGKACKVIPGGVNSPVRAFKSVGGQPVIIRSARGSHITDIDGNEYIDFIGSWGPMILGHAFPPVIGAIQETAIHGTSFGAPNMLETEMAELIVKLVPSIEMVRMVNSGTEATMSAIRLARGFTGRQKILKFTGCYHGHGDSFLIKAGSGALTLGLPDSPGVTADTAKDTLTADYNHLDSVIALFDQYPDQIAAIIVEPVAANMGVVLPQPGFLDGLREICTKKGSLLIFDEVITGFRLSAGGAQEYFDVMPDITTMGKIIGGGLPVGAYGGRKDIMEQLAPAGPIYQAGTLSGNPLAMAAGLETLRVLDEYPELYHELSRKAEVLENGLKEGLKEAGISGVINRAGSLLTLFFTELPKVESFDDVMTCDKEKYARFFRLCLESGVYMAPSQFEAAFLSAAHTDEDLEKTIKAAKAALLKLQ